MKLGADTSFGSYLVYPSAEVAATFTGALAGIVGTGVVAWYGLNGIAAAADPRAFTPNADGIAVHLVAFASLAVVEKETRIHIAIAQVALCAHDFRAGA